MTRRPLGEPATVGITHQLSAGFSHQGHRSRTRQVRYTKTSASFVWFAVAAGLLSPVLALGLAIVGLVQLVRLGDENGLSAVCQNRGESGFGGHRVEVW